MEEIKNNLSNYILTNDNDFMFGTYVKVIDIYKVLDQVEKEKDNERD